ncbi:MAG TPA: L-seryl-tRNA(Sec) selenium transferase, partial [Enterobacteriaceae bacterium]|nr:L-seryl-tRNA(Sec) selenium transferase [Enterobacteriaceae bacterium]
MTTENRSLYSQIPSTDSLLRDAAFQPLLAQWGHTQVAAMLRQLQVQARNSVRESQMLPAWCHDWAAMCAQRLSETTQSALRTVFNLT